MISIQAQYDGKAFHPYTDKDRDEAATYKKNQIVTLDVKGTQRVRSLPQLRLYWVCCRLVAENTDDSRLKDKDMVSEQVKVALNFVDLNRSFVDMKTNTFHPRYRSISYKNLKQIEADRFFDRAFEVMATWLGTDVATLTGEAECQG